MNARPKGVTPADGLTTGPPGTLPALAAWVTTRFDACAETRLEAGSGGR